MAATDVPEPKSKSQLKRDSEDLKELGEALIKMSPAERARVPLPEAIDAAIELAQRITSHGAMRRQVQYLGKLLRETDAAPIRAAVEAIRHTGLQSAAHFQRLERWRDRLLAEGDPAISEFLEVFPAADRNQLRQLVRAATKESTDGAPPKSARALFRLLREFSERSPADEE
jgi:ribosome-associated protein